MSFNKIIELGQQDLVLEAQLQRITYQANDENKGTKNIIRDRITDDMVDTFNKQFKQPITKRVNVLDDYGNSIPEVDEDGDDREDAEGNTIYKTKEVQYKYRTPEMDLDLEAVNPFELEHVLTSSQLTQSKEDATDLVYRYQQNELRIERLKDEIEAETKKINSIAVSVAMGTPSKKGGSKTRKALLAINAKKDEITRIIAENGNIEAEIIRLRKEIQDNEGNEAHNDGVRRSVMKRNADKVNAYSNELSSLNRGQFRMDKYPDETDEDFVKRLRDVGQTEYEESDQYDSAYLSNMTQFKTNMKNITRDEALIDSLLRSMSPEELFKLNQKFPLYKSEFLKIYGAFNKTINYEDVVETIKIFLVKGSLNVGSDRNNTAPQILQGNELVAGKFTYSKHANDTLAIQNIENQNILYLKVSKTTDNKGC
jgi:alkylhydroperoxidase/carboxymuconolactone decarboxylase family protein YurZ